MIGTDRADCEGRGEVDHARVGILCRQRLRSEKNPEGKGRNSIHDILC